MADRPDSDREVLTSLPRTRPVRRSAKRAERPRTAAAATKPTSKSTSAAADRPKARKPAAKPRVVAQPKATARAASAEGARATAQRTRSTPRKAVPPAGYSSSPIPGEDGRSASADLLGTTVQAAGELAQIGFAVARQALQSMLDRLPKP